MNFAVVFAFLAWASTVLAAGPKAHLPSCYPLDQPAEGSKQKQPYIDCEKCRGEAVIIQTLTGKAAYIPQCIAKTNKFAPKQCDASTGVCWCSTPYGIEIPNTKTTNQKLNCNKKAKPSHNCKKRASTVGYKPKCNEEDFHNTQCLLNGFCWCSMKDGFYVPNTIHRKNQKTNCRKHTDLKFECGNRSGHLEHPFDPERYIKCGAGRKAYACSCLAKKIFDPKEQICREPIAPPPPEHNRRFFEQLLRLNRRFTGSLPKDWGALKNSPPLQFANVWAKELLKFVKADKKERQKKFPIQGQKSVAIVGAGPAGLTAAYELSRHSNLNITIFEKSKRVGGRVLTVGVIGGFQPGGCQSKGFETFNNQTPWIGDSRHDITYGEAGAMRLPLIPDVLAKNKWDISKLNDAEINDLVHGKSVGKHGKNATDTDFPMPLIRHYIKKFKVPVRRFNMCPTIANVDVNLKPNPKTKNATERLFKKIFVNKNGILKAPTKEGLSLDDSVLAFLEKDDEIRTWMNHRGVKKNGMNLHDILDKDLTRKAAEELANGNLNKPIIGDDYLKWVTLSSWNQFLRNWNVTYKDYLKEQKWPERLIEFFGHVYRTDMSGKINHDIPESELGHWWQPNMFTPKYGMHSLWDTPKKNFPKKKDFQGFRQHLNANNTQILFGKEVTKITGSKGKASVFLDKSEKEFGKFDYVLVAVPMYYIKKIKFDGDFKDMKLDHLQYRPLNLAKKIYQFRKPFWDEPENNLGNFNVSTMKGFAVIASSNPKPHLTQFRYSNPKYEGNVILAYETGGADAKLLEKMKDEKVLEYIQKNFQTKQAHVKKNAFCLSAPVSCQTGKYKKAWVNLASTSDSAEEVSQKQRICCNTNNKTEQLLFASDTWSYMGQWQEGAINTAIHAAFRILNSASGARLPDPFQYLKN